MALSVQDAFAVLVGRLAPTAAEQAAAYSHRSSVETALRRRLPVKRFRQIGSFDHGTGVRHHADVDLLVSLGGIRPSTDAALAMVRMALREALPTTTIRVNRPAVVVRFAGGRQTWEVIPAPLYDIPAPSGWLTSAPTAHLDYVTGINTTAGKQGGAKALTRLIKAWKYYNKVPVSSFYLEMRAARYMATRRGFTADVDLRRLLQMLAETKLAPMNDPRKLSVGSRRRPHPATIAQRFPSWPPPRHAQEKPTMPLRPARSARRSGTGTSSSDAGSQRGDKIRS
ncbi:hypothetical protein [Enterococcus hirae]|uniref:hypothetical protein n=1 Tax=Enterococcus hirae TaxID=1354 RepID=UPI00196618B0|nr:hypothetical protein [Enterococcus hirae]